MLRTVRMENFRRHARTNIELGDEDRTIVVAGRNGAGKSTIIEAITYGLVGEGRHGGRNLDRLVRRGAELEGMEVELAFDIDNAIYRVVRRREGKAATAVLSINGQPLVEGTRHVTAAIEDLLGMDSQGVRLAVVAQQKELDLLVRLGGPQRAKALGRLLRLDALSKARDDARQHWRSANGALDVIPRIGDLTALASRVGAKETASLQAQVAESACRGAVATLEAELAATAGIDMVYQAARENLARSAATTAAVRQELARFEAEQHNIRIPELLPEVESIATLERQATELEHSIAHAEAAKRISEQRRIIVSELTMATKRREELVNGLATGDTSFFKQQASELRNTARQARSAALEAASKREHLREELGSVRSDTQTWVKRRNALLELGPVCLDCGQDVGAEHLDKSLTQADEHLAANKVRESEIVSEGQSVREEWQRCETLTQDSEQGAGKADAHAQSASSAEGEIAELDRRIESYTGQLERLIVDESDIEALYERKGAITLSVMNAKAALERRRERENALGRFAELELNIADTQMRLADSEQVEAAMAMDSMVEKAFVERQKLLDTHRAELEMLGVLTAQSAEARGAETAAHAELRQANETAGLRRVHEQKGVNASNAGRLLGDVEQTLGGQIRPLLEGSVSEILAKMSGGRFSSVRVGPEYDMTVLDDGAYRSLGELSGGEADLAALALRLGLSDVICSRNGGVGFLILDEVFGSQDAERRESIFTALRALRGTYGQIWCISHVGGLDDAADRVINVDIDEDGITQAS